MPAPITPPTPDPDPDTTDKSGLGSRVELVKTFADAIKQNGTTRADKEISVRADEALAHFALMFAHVEFDEDTDRDILVLAVLTPEFKEILNRSNARSAMEAMQRSHSASLRRLDPDSRLDANVTMPASALDEPLVRALKSGRFCTEPLNKDHTPAKQQLSLLAFLTPDVGSTQYQSRLSASQEILTLEVADLDKAKPKTTTSLYLGGQLLRGSDVSAAIANLRAVLAHHFTNFEKSEVWRRLLSLDRLLATESGRSWLRSYQTGNPALAQTLLGQAQCIMSAYAGIAGHDDFRKAARTGEAISPKAIKAIGQYADGVLAELSRDISVHCSKNWMTTPRYILFLKGTQDPPTSAPSKEPDSKKARNEPNPSPAPTPGQARSPTTSANQLTEEMIKDRKEKGFLLWSKTGTPRPCPVMWSIPPSGSAKRFCTNFATRGLACRFNKCNNHHVTAFTAIPTAQQPEFTTWLTGVAGLEYVAGRAPPGA
jgi:hypothetical protein